MSKVADSIRRGLEQAVTIAADEANKAPPDTLDPRIRRIAEAIGRHMARKDFQSLAGGTKGPIEGWLPPIEDSQS